MLYKAPEPRARLVPPDVNEVNALDPSAVFEIPLESEDKTESPIPVL